MLRTSYLNGTRRRKECSLATRKQDGFRRFTWVRILLPRNRPLQTFLITSSCLKTKVIKSKNYYFSFQSNGSKYKSISIIITLVSYLSWCQELSGCQSITWQLFSFLFEYRKMIDHGPPFQWITIMLKCALVTFDQ